MQFCFMKHRIRISLFILLVVSSVCMGQRIRNTQQFNRSDFFDRSRAHRNTGWILLGGGALAVVGGFAIFANNVDLWNDSNDNVEV